MLKRFLPTFIHQLGQGGTPTLSKVPQRKTFSCQHDLVGSSQRVNLSCHPLSTLVYSTPLVWLMTLNFYLCKPSSQVVSVEHLLYPERELLLLEVQNSIRNHTGRDLWLLKIKALNLQKARIWFWLRYPSTPVHTRQSEWPRLFFNRMTLTTTVGTQNYKPLPGFKKEFCKKFKK